MIRYQKGNLLDADAEALVNTVNTVGVMGKGIALQFKEAFPQNYAIYKKACKIGEIAVGKLLTVKELTTKGEKWIVNFPTKKDWKNPSKYEYIEEGLKDLLKVIQEKNIRSIALPPLGCGNGGLDWEKVRPLIEQYLSQLTQTQIIIYEPNEEIKTLLQQQEQTKQAHLTPARAILLYALFYYELLGEHSSLFAANKLAYFLQRLGEKLKLDFKAHFYGPYSPQVEKVLYHLNGVYLNGLEQNKVSAFEPLVLDYSKLPEVQNYLKTALSSEQQQRLDNLLLLIDGFQSTLSLEVLATVDYVMNGKEMTEEEVIKATQDWSIRKQKLFKDKYISIAYRHLKAYREGALL